MEGALVFAVVFLTAFGGSLIGMGLQRRLPAHHITAETREPLKAVLGLVATLAALLISLLIASAKESYGTQRREVEELAVGFAQFDRILTHFGPEGTTLKPLSIDMRRSTRDALWRHGVAGAPAERRADAASDRLIDALSGLQTTRAQSTMQGRLIEIFSSVSRNRLLLSQQASGTVPPALLALLTMTIAALFLGFALLAPTNPTLVVAAAAGAFAIAAAVLLLVAFDHPFEGLMALQPFATPPR